MVRLLVAVRLDGDSVRQHTADVVVAVHQFQRRGVQRFDHRKLEGVVLAVVDLSHRRAAPFLDGVGVGGVGVYDAILADVPHILEGSFQRGGCIGGQLGAQRRNKDRAADFGFGDADVLCIVWSRRHFITPRRCNRLHYRWTGTWRLCVRYRRRKNRYKTPHCRWRPARPWPAWPA